MKPNYKERKCVICGKTYKPVTSNQKTCCKECKKKYYKLYYIKNKDKRLKYQKEYNKKHIEQIKQRYEYNKIYIKKKCPICNNVFYETNKNKICCSNKCHKEYKKNYNKKYLNKKYKNNINFKLTVLLRSHFRRYINLKKTEHTFDILGYTPLQLKQRLEYQFKNGMTWSNYGTLWQIHHKKPLYKFNFSLRNGEIDYKQVKLANSLANLQPITIEEHKKIKH